jgi:hypothetical protein
MTLVASLWMEAVALGGMGDYQQALNLQKQVLETAEEIGEPWWWARALNLMGWLYAELQDPRTAL